VAAYTDPGNNNLLFMGGFAHYPNIIAVKKLALDIFPKIKQQVGSARLVIAGSQASQEVVDLGKLPGVEFLGFIEENSIGDLYKNAFLALAPLQAGAGIKGKICEAISYRVPVVTNSIGNEGIGLVNEQSGLVSDSDEELVKLAVKALGRGYELGKMTQAAQSKLYDLVGPKTVKKNMLQSIAVPEVSICIVTWNKQKLLQRCIESIENHTQGIKYRILVYSNGCTDGTRQYLEAAARLNPNIVPILSDTNDVFVIPNNRMVQLFPANDVVLLNNDTYVTDGWLTAMRDAAYSSPEIGIVGSKILYPDGKLQEFGSELYSDGTGRNIGKWDDPDREEYNSPKFAGYVSGCAFYVKRATVDQIGFFDEDFHPCYCEDSDYCYTAWEHGIATLVTPDSVIYHDEGGTSGTDTSKGFKAYQKVNFEKFLKKHGGQLDGISTKIKLKNLAAAAGTAFSHSEM
jgi:GT2 family glycosyltransferase